MFDGCIVDFALEIYQQMTKESDSPTSNQPLGISPARRGAPNLENAGRRAEDQTTGRP
jgi:hypothetical protein